MIKLKTIKSCQTNVLLHNCFKNITMANFIKTMEINKTQINRLEIESNSD